MLRSLLPSHHLDCPLIKPSISCRFMPEKQTPRTKWTLSLSVSDQEGRPVSAVMFSIASSCHQSELEKGRKDTDTDTREMTQILKRLSRVRWETERKGILTATKFSQGSYTAPSISNAIAQPTRYTLFFFFLIVIFSEADLLIKKKNLKQS